jgi:hypothetical protein
MCPPPHPAPLSTSTPSCSLATPQVALAAQGLDLHFVSILSSSPGLCSPLQPTHICTLAASHLVAVLLLSPGLPDPLSWAHPCPSHPPNIPAS